MWLDDIIDLRQLMTRIIKYLVQGIVIAIAAFAIPRQSMRFDEICALALVAAATFSLLDAFMPVVGFSAKQGAGLAIGATMVGFPMGL
jgi:ABC-type Co2+ transport system permease subunit